MVTLEEIRAAQERIAGRLQRTPLLGSTALAARSGVARFQLKCESFQTTGSFKVRGVLNRLDQLSADARDRGVVTVSAGNHAQALAWGAREAGVRCTVVMPENASRTKVEASAGYGATVIQVGTSLVAATPHAVQWQWVRGHAGHPQNEYANDLAVNAARSQSTSEGARTSLFDDWLEVQRSRKRVKVEPAPFPSGNPFAAARPLPRTAAGA